MNCNNFVRIWTPCQHIFSFTKIIHIYSDVNIITKLGSIQFLVLYLCMLRSRQVCRVRRGGMLGIAKDITTTIWHLEYPSHKKHIHSALRWDRSQFTFAIKYLQVRFNVAGGLARTAELASFTFIKLIHILQRNRAVELCVTMPGRWWIANQLRAVKKARGMYNLHTCLLLH